MINGSNLQATMKDANIYIPHEVVGRQLKEGLSLIAAWRKHLKITQKELADSKKSNLLSCKAK